MIITVTSFSSAQDRTTGRNNPTLAKVAKRNGFIPGQVIISPDGRTVFASAAQKYYRPKPTQ